MKGIVVPTLIIAVFYFLATTYLMNSRLAIDTLIGSYPLSYKLSLFTDLVLGMSSVMGTFGLTVLSITALLTGADLALLAQRIATMTRFGNIHLMVSGSSVLSFATSGCVACGLPILSLLGLGGSLAFLPLRGLELSYFSIMLLTISLIVLVRTDRQSCPIPKK